MVVSNVNEPIHQAGIDYQPTMTTGTNNHVMKEEHTYSSLNRFVHMSDRRHAHKGSEQEGKKLQTLCYITS
jgi:hypothetical protein